MYTQLSTTQFQLFTSPFVLKTDYWYGESLLEFSIYGGICLSQGLIWSVLVLVDSFVQVEFEVTEKLSKSVQKKSKQ